MIIDCCIADKFSERIIMLRNRESCFFEHFKKHTMRSKFIAEYYFPLLVFLLQYTSKIEFFKDDKASVSRKVIFKFSDQDSISTSKDWKSWQLIIFPLSIDVLSMWNVDKCGSIKFVLFPVGEIEGEIIINENADSMSLIVGIHWSLIFSVSIVKRLVLHFNIKRNNVNRYLLHTIKLLPSFYY